MKKYIINPEEYNVDLQLEGFEIIDKTGGTIEYYGTNGADIFFQFMHGVSYVYSDVDKELIAELHKTDNLGLYMSKLSRKYTFQKTNKKLVTSKNEETEQTTA